MTKDQEDIFTQDEPQEDIFTKDEPQEDVTAQPHPRSRPITWFTAVVTRETFR